MKLGSVLGCALAFCSKLNPTPQKEAEKISAFAMTNSFLSDELPPHAIYETLYAFKDTWGNYMGAPGTTPWLQGFPITTALEKFGGPPLPSSVEVSFEVREAHA